MNDRGKSAALELLHVSRETEQRLVVFENLLRRWQAKINLVSANSLPQLWLRHIADSGQLLGLVPPKATEWADIGSGAGFPGAIIGIMFADSREGKVHLIESDRRKAEFLRTVSRETGAPLQIHCERAERALLEIASLDVVCSRATASLAQLLTWAGSHIERGATGLFLRGETVRTELTRIQCLNRIHISLTPSLTNAAAAVVVARASNSGR